MILKGLREKSNQKHINRLLNSRETRVSDTKISSLGVILNTNEFNNFEAFRDLAKAFKVNPNNIKIIAFTEDHHEVETTRELLFSSKQIGWNAKIKDPDLQQFLDKEFDALLCYYKEEVLELNLAVALSKANFKIGLSGHDERLYDLIIDINGKDFNLFTSELKKYLNIFNKL